jgi:hypothetical protein
MLMETEARSIWGRPEVIRVLAREQESEGEEDEGDGDGDEDEMS